MILLDKQELNSPYAKSFHLGLLKSIEEDRRRKPPVKPVSSMKKLLNFYLLSKLRLVLVAREIKSFDYRNRPREVD